MKCLKLGEVNDVLKKENQGLKVKMGEMEVEFKENYKRT